MRLAADNKWILSTPKNYARSDVLCGASVYLDNLFRVGKVVALLRVDGLESSG